MSNVCLIISNSTYDVYLSVPLVIVALQFDIQQTSMQEHPANVNSWRLNNVKPRCCIDVNLWRHIDVNLWHQSMTSHWRQSVTSHWRHQSVTSHWRQYVMSHWRQSVSSHWRQITSHWCQSVTSGGCPSMTSSRSISYRWYLIKIQDNMTNYI